MLKIALLAVVFAAISMIWLDVPVLLAVADPTSVFWHTITDIRILIGLVALAFLLGLVFAWRNQARPRNAAFYVFSSASLSWLASQALKVNFGRARPEHLETLGHLAFRPFTAEHSFASMPSGHATTAFALGVTCAIVFPKLRVLFASFALLVGFSRMPVGAHYLSDVIMGAALGTLGALALAKYLRGHKVPFSFGK